MDDPKEVLHIQVCFATPQRQDVRDLSVPGGTNLLEAIQLSGMLQDVPNLDLSNCKVGIFGKLRELNTLLHDRDRIEIYRSLIADPKESRRKRAEKKDQNKTR